MKYDVIVVGAGSGGATVAARLSEDPSRSVLLLEAGPDYPDIDTLPFDLKFNHGTGTDLAVGGEHDWQYTGNATAEAPPMPVPRGKVTGGTSAELALAMATMARQKLGASIGIGIEGESRTESASGMVPGTVFVATDGELIEQNKVQIYSGRLYQMKKRAAYYALFDLVKLLRSIV